LKSKTDEKTYIRKAAYEYGWTGSALRHQRHWKPARLEAWNNVRLADFAIRQRDVSKDVAHADAEVEVEASAAGPAVVKVSYLDAAKPVTLSRSVTVHAGSNLIDLPVEIRQPKLWYPAGYGDQPLYEFTAVVSSGLRRRLRSRARSRSACAPSCFIASGQVGPQLRAGGQRHPCLCQRCRRDSV